MRIFVLLFFILSYTSFTRQVSSQPSIAKEWNKELIAGINRSRSQASVHARSLYQWSLIVYDCWSVYQPSKKPYFLGSNLKGFPVPFEGIPIPNDPKNRKDSVKKAISFASFRFLKHQFRFSPGHGAIIQSLRTKMQNLGYNLSDTSKTYFKTGNSSHLGNYIAYKMNKYGEQDGSRENKGYKNETYKPLNDTLLVNKNRPNDLNYPNHWQPLKIAGRTDKAGNPVKSIQSSLTPYWGDVDVFAMPDSARSTKLKSRPNGKIKYNIWFDPGPPPYLDTTAKGQCLKNNFKWGFCMPVIWQSHLDPSDTTTWDVSPRNIGNIDWYPKNHNKYDSFYNFFKGGTVSLGNGYDKNPVTNAPYKTQRVKRADYARVLVEQMADGFVWETPPANWFNVYNKVSQKPGFTRKWKGKGHALSKLAYDVKAYFSLGGALHDAGIAAWSVKGWYDYLRPISAVRWMASQGQCSKPNRMSYDPNGIPLIPNYIELVDSSDKLSGSNYKNVGKIKLYTWRGYNHLNPAQRNTDTAGVGWILANNWWPYQNPFFVTPPFPGYVSGHSTFAAAASRILTKITGSPYFPGGKSDFKMPANKWLDYENGPSETIKLTYAKYKDYADQEGLSRIWGGIHSPYDDIAGRRIGNKVSKFAFQKADKVITKNYPYVEKVTLSDSNLSVKDIGDTLRIGLFFNQPMLMSRTPKVKLIGDYKQDSLFTKVSAKWMGDKHFNIRFLIDSSSVNQNDFSIKAINAKSQLGIKQKSFLALNDISLNTTYPKVDSVNPSVRVVNESIIGQLVKIGVSYSEPMDTLSDPVLKLDQNNTLTLDKSASRWVTKEKYQAVYKTEASNEFSTEIGIQISKGRDRGLNDQIVYTQKDILSIVTVNPKVETFNLNKEIFSKTDAGKTVLNAKLVISREVDTSKIPALSFEGSLATPFARDLSKSKWLSDSSVRLAYRLTSKNLNRQKFKIKIVSLKGVFGNTVLNSTFNRDVIVDTRRPAVEGIETAKPFLARDNIGDNGFKATIRFNELMNQNQKPVVSLVSPQLSEGIVKYDLFSSQWKDSSTYQALFDVKDTTLEKHRVDLAVNFGEDLLGNRQEKEEFQDFLSLDLAKPVVRSVTASNYFVDKGSDSVSVLIVYNKPMDTTKTPFLGFKGIENKDLGDKVQISSSKWLSSFVKQFHLKLKSIEGLSSSLNLIHAGAQSLSGNKVDTLVKSDFLAVKSVGMETSKRRSSVVNITPNYIPRGRQRVKIDLNRPLENPKAILFNSKGQVVIQKSYNGITSGTRNMTANFRSPGIYLLKIQAKHSAFGKKIVVH